MSQNVQPPAPDAATPPPSPAQAPAPSPYLAPYPSRDLAQSAPAAPAATGNIGLGIAAAVVAAVVTAAIYGAIIGATNYQIGYAAAIVGAAIGFAAGRFGGRNPLLPVLSVLLAVAAVLGGQIYGMAMIVAEQSGVATTDVLDLGISMLFDGWLEDAGPMTFLFFALGGYAAFQTARKTAA